MEEGPGRVVAAAVVEDTGATEIGHKKGYCPGSLMTRGSTQC